MADLNIDELYADVFASTDMTGIMGKTLHDFVRKLRTGDVFAA